MQTDSSDSQSGYTLRGRGEIIEKLTLMQKKKCLLSAQTKGGGASFVTTVIQVMADRSLVVLDMSENPAVNRQLLAADQIVCSANVDGIQSRFTLGGLTEATLKGQNVFAAKLPESLFWFQQRKFYRVTVPLAMAVKCRIKNQEGALELDVLDLSISGLALYDRHNQLDDGIDVGQVLEICTLELPGHGAFHMALEVRNKIPMTWTRPPAGQRVGCAFHSLSRHDEILLQKFIYEIELQKKRQESLLKG